MQLNTGTGRGNEDWALYTLEEPLVRIGGKVQRCHSPSLPPHLQQRAEPINPLGIYLDETLKLDYHLKSPWRGAAGGNVSSFDAGSGVAEKNKRPKREVKSVRVSN